MACKYCGDWNSFLWRGIEICNNNPECLDKAILEDGTTPVVVIDDEDEEEK
ncbi:hypothetical protein [Thermoactinomyces sp. CICC 10521]|uniref:hypothetical protein n=1 Tax=Thermoactinomyces sp. CICC 10521 TaxID=2767426 RepID=UPI0018DCB1FF|nr:hypothetical protein [Thermoactinomyces sp. CICC 10521]MBH8608921.1 hypothetical protein [Thermoactinomyces sp. CICC 10521]